ncbi:acyltransferase family protein [Nonomuraea cavernae]|uniref:acyltransferase family protein n=1 Tax=Nonomuraea cavernae TaxID=2045107 RepID=UPI00166318C0|nr:acyltransferase [Nonomuraea cavernae]MCA2189786.1 acyltransferase [Nonomuraea cavernae]
MPDERTTGVLQALFRRSHGVARALRQAAERTPPERERLIDLLRAVAISMVVLGHWLSVSVTYRGGFGGASALEVLPWTRPLTWLFQVMPVFFLVGGFANAASLDSQRRRGGTAVSWLLSRTARLVAPTSMLVLVLSGVACLALVLGADPKSVGTAVWLACVPLWFLIVYLAAVFLTPVMLALDRRAGLAVPVVLMTLVALGDVARLLGRPSLGQANFLLAWLAVHQLGIAWREGTLPVRRAVALPMAAGGLAALVALTVAGPYPISMVAIPGERLQNTSPPTLALLALAVTQTGIVFLLHDRGIRWLGRPRPWLVIVAVNSVIMTVFLWHLTAVVIAALALYPTGLMPQPATGSAQWLLLRLPWLAILAVLLTVLVALFGWVERRARPITLPQANGGLRTAATVTGAAAVIAGLLGAALAGQGALPVLMLPVYLCGAALLRLARVCPGSR